MMPAAGLAALPLSLRLALRELRGGLSGFYVFIACIALGVAAIAGVNSVSRSLTEGIASQGRIIIGGDLAFSLLHREATPDELAFFEQAGEVGRVATMRAMLRNGDTAQSLVELKAVDAAYPHGGEMRLADGGTVIQPLLAQDDGRFGALVAPELLDRLGAAIGDEVTLGTLPLRIRGVIAFEPDFLSSGIGFGPRLIVSDAALAASGLVRPGSLVTWTYRIRMPDGQNGSGAMGRVRGSAGELFPDAGWSIRARDNPAPTLSRNVDRFMQFLTLVGLTALVVGGVGVANAVTGFVDLKRPAIATLKCLGASAGLVFRVYLTQIVILACAGIGIGLLLGAALPYLARILLADILPVAVDGLPLAELAMAALYGLLVAVAFALGPLGRAREMRAANLFADRALHERLAPPLRFRLAQAVALACLAALAILLAGDRELASLFVGAVAVAFVVLRLVAVGIMALARRSGTLRGTALRMAVRNIHRPGGLTASVVLSLGLGLTLLVSLALIDSNLRNQLSGSIAEQAPDFFFLDIQNGEREAFLSLVSAAAPAGEIETVPMLRGRIASLKGIPASEVEPGEGAGWALRGDRGLTYSDTVPSNSTVVAGEWWPRGYSGPPLVSMEDEIAAGLGLTIGDEVTVNVLGRNVAATVANLRRLDWESLSINFVMVFSPNTFSGAPHTHLATLRLDRAGTGAEREVMSAVTRDFPGVTTISVRDAIEQVNALISDLALAVRIAASAALAVSMLVLGGALAAGHRQRRQDAVILKALGATRQKLLGAFSLEYGMLGVATAFFAVAAGTAAAWYVAEQVMDLPFSFHPAVALVAVVVALCVTLGVGLVGTWRILSVKPAPLLKNL